MKHLSLSILLAAALPLAAPAQAPAPPAASDQAKVEKPTHFDLGTAVPADLVLTDLDGKTLSMKDLRGKVVVVTWYAIYCPGIKLTVERLKELAKEYGEGEDVVLLAINSDKGELADAKPVGMDKEGKPLQPFPRIRAYMADKKVNFRMFVDPGNLIADKFRAKTTPHMFVLDRKGVVRYSGALDNQMHLKKDKEGYEPYVRNAVAAILAGEEPAVTKTRPYG